MRPRIVVWILLLAAAAGAEDVERVALRVSSTDPVLVDRGSSDGLQAGDEVLFYPREGGTYRGRITETQERSAVVELDDANFVPEPGTRGEALLPADRFAPEPVPEELETGPETTEHPPWKNRDEEWSPDKPLLAGLQPVRPNERARSIRGRAYVIGGVASDADDAYLRVGADATGDNPFGWGGRLRLAAEIDSLTEWDGDEGVDFLLRRLSYARGGTRFSKLRWEVGRFLQHGMPEFGVLDGGEASLRTDNGHRFGLSVGFLPEPDDDFETFNDFSLAGWYEWVSDPREQLTITAGFQKTWHEGEADRDLLVVRVRSLPLRGWDLHGTVWIDFYTAGDDIKGSGVELTQAVVSALRRWDNGNGFDVVFRHVTFPEIARNEFLPLGAADIEDNRVDRLSVEGWRWLDPNKRAHAHLSGFNDEDESGANLEGGLEVHDLLGRGSRADVTVYFHYGEIETILGARASYGRSIAKGRWDVLYEIGQHRFDGFPDDRDDLLQHRLRASGSIQLAPLWDLSAHAEAIYSDDDFTWSIGFHLQRRF